MSIKRNAKEYFTFNKRERRALLILSVLIVLIGISPQLYLLLKPNENVDTKKFETGVRKFYAAQTKSGLENQNLSEEIVKNDLINNSTVDSINTGKKIVQLFSFDPNTSTENDFAKLGLNSRTIKSIVNYRNKGGHFKTAEDFKKIYTLSEEDYNRLKGFITIVDAVTPIEKSTDQKSYASYQPKIIDINLADSIEWEKLPGIGPYLTSKILKYRNALGGFFSINQIAEVYGMKPETYDVIKEKIKCDALSISSIKKININTIGKDELNAHPYINYRQATILVNYREQHGPYKNIDEIKNTESFTETELEKIKPYLSVN